EEEEDRSLFRFLKGVFYFFHRDEPGEYDVQTPGQSAIIRGTEFHLAVTEAGETSILMIDGEVLLWNKLGELPLRSGESGAAATGTAPRKTPRLEAINIMQWALYYPACVYWEDLPFTAAELLRIESSLTAYRRGDPAVALARMPESTGESTPGEEIYRAALLLSVGGVAEAEQHLVCLETGGFPVDHEQRGQELVGALRTVIAAVKLQPRPKSGGSPATASAWLGESFYRQSRGDLTGALEAVRRSVELAPEFGFAWAQLAELEFGHGRNRPARQAVERSLALAPIAAQPWALRGFLRLAENRVAEARRDFERAIDLDNGLGNAWLGRGLARIRHGDTRGGVADLEMAVLAEPQRAAFRSYLGKAFSLSRNDPKALVELDLAKRFDPGDPT
ncbi:MAG: tetratricopeptide repeat protein, partial [Verrucomicrobiae bacterium]|nr:tetratricopeptide repeat protein [Verrucomicrobiae bacterium]